MKVVDQLNAYGSYVPENQVRLREAAYRMGTRMVESLWKKNSEITWESEEGICPVCHCNEMTLNGTPTVCCPICGIYGTLKVDGNRITVEFTEEEQYRSRLKLTGVIEHQVEQNRKDRYPNFDDYVGRFLAAEDEL